MADMEKETAMSENDAGVTPTDEAVAKSSVAEKSAVAAPKKKSKSKKERKPNIFTRLGRKIAKFFRDYNSERKKISWKPWNEVCKSALIVIVTVVSFSLVIWGMDAAFGSLFSWLGNLI